jgi:peptide/nickel transport system permease protein
LGSFIVRRILQTILVVVLVTLVVFLLLQLIPGDPARIMLGTNASQEQVDVLRRELWLDRPLVDQYLHWASNALHGNFGHSVIYNEDAAGLILKRLPISLYLGAIALVVSIVIGVFMGIICAIRRTSILDNFISLFANVGIAIPIFWLGIIGIYLFAYKLSWLPIQGFVWPTVNFGKSISLTVMPVICMAVPMVAVIARQTRSSMLEVIGQDYIRTARAKGLRENYITIRHALKNAMIPVVTIMGMQVRILIGGQVLVETVFNIPGLGRLIVNAALSKDFLVIQAAVVIIAIITCVANLLVDISYGWLDPRTRYD